MMTKRFLAYAIVLTLGACAEKPLTISAESPAEAAINHAMHSLKQKEMDRCFTPQVSNADGATRIIIYDVIRQSSPVKQCSLFFTSDGHGGFKPTMRASFHDGITSEACDLKALSCARPAQARRIAAKYGLAIDPTQ